MLKNNRFVILILFCFVSLHAQTQHLKSQLNNLPTIHLKGGSESYILFEDFERETFPPTGWSQLRQKEDVWQTVKNNDTSWQKFQQPRQPFQDIESTSKYSALCQWTLDTLNEWLISPNISIVGYDSLLLTFYAGFNPQWTENANLTLWYSVDNGQSWEEDKLWSAKDEPVELEKWNWQIIRINLNDFLDTTLSENNIKFAWQYSGVNGDLVAIDNVALDPHAPNYETEITEFSVNEQVEKASISTKNQTINVKLKYDTPLPKSFTPTLKLSQGATCLPASNSPITFYENQPVEYTVTAQDGVTQQIWEVSFNLAVLNTGTNINSFSVPNQTVDAEIDKDRKQIFAEVGYLTDLSVIKPEFSFAAGAYVDFDTAQTMSFEVNIPKTILVYAEDPTVEPAEWAITIFKKDYETEIDSLYLLNIKNDTIAIAEIDSINRKISIPVHYSHDLSNVTPLIFMSPAASCEPPSGVAADFSKSQNYQFTVTAERDSVSVWDVKFIEVIDTIESQNFDLATNIPSGWSLKSSNLLYTWLFSNEIRSPFTEINSTNKYSAVCPWNSYSTQREKLESPEIFIPEKTEVLLKFYCGYKSAWLTNARLEILVERKIDGSFQKNTEPIWQTPQDTIKNWQWREFKLSLNDYKKDTLKIIFNYTGEDGDLIAIDDVLVGSKDIAEAKDYQEKNNHTKIILAGKIYPNPCSDFITIEANENSFYTLYSIYGKKISQNKLTVGKNKLNTKNLTAGAYYIKINSTNSATVQYVKIIIK